MDTAVTTVGIQLPIVLPPYPEESFLGYLTRIAHLNLRESAIELALLAGVDRPVLSDIQRRGTGEAAIATLCGISPSELRRRRHASLGGSHDPINLAAGTINPNLVRSNRPRIAPKAYADRPYHRYEWDFEFLTFDPETGEHLIDACPHCGEGLSWSRPSFLSCVSCGQPLVGLGERHVDEDVRAVGRTFADILSLDEGRRIAARTKLAPEVRDLPTEALFRFLFEISNLFEFKKYTKRERPTELNWPSILVRAYQIATEWPEALLTLLEETRLDSSGRAGRYGLRKEFGDLGVLLREWDAVAEIKAVVLPTLREYLKAHPEIALKAKSRIAEAILPESRYANLNEIRHQYGWSHRKAARLREIPGVVTGPVEGSGAPLMVDRQIVAEIHDALASLINRRTIRNIWGLPHDAVNQIAAAGIFEAVNEPYVALVENADGLFRREQVQSIIDQAHTLEHQDVYEGLTLSFNRAVCELGKEVKEPWPIVLRAVLRGELKAVKISQKLKGGFGRIRFKRQDVEDWISLQVRNGARTYSISEAGDRLKIHPDVMSVLIEKGYLKPLPPRAGERGRRLTISELARFADEYVSSASLAERYAARSNFLIDSLEVSGVSPIKDFSQSRRIYRWSDIPPGFRILTRFEIEKARLSRGISIVRHPWQNRPR